ncbi:steroid receptor RNA activator 1-like [Lytechinus pictus]|uniref:steroid receptor RNA activator 1-like n=1 Tax=Lytechinus pictus TaxID=7653 RepID=UPI0030B9E28B
MEEEMRLGNRDRGWNDPPSFSYDKTSQTTPRKNLLNQRVAMPQNYPSPSTATLSPASGPPSSTGPPLSTGKSPFTGSTLTSGPPPSTGPPTGPPLPSSLSLPGTGPSRAMTSSGKSPVCDDGDGEDVSCEATVAMFRKVFEECQDKLQKRVISDIERRLKLLEDSWQNKKLSSPVQKRTSRLATELKARKYDSAHEIHLSLMVDHVSEVSQWMVGIKRLIHEARIILPFTELETRDSISAEDRPRTIDQDQEPSVPTAKGEDRPRTVDQVQEHSSVPTINDKDKVQELSSIPTAKGEDKPGTVDQVQEPSSVPTAKGDADSSIQGPSESDCNEESRKETEEVEEDRKGMENLNITKS